MLKITIIAAGNKMPSWIQEGYLEFSKRLHDGISIQLLEVPLEKRNKNADLKRIMDKEAQLMLQCIPSGSFLIALDIQGKSFSSDSLALHLQELQQQHSHLCFLIGGPEGLSPILQAKCNEKWSLSQLTLPHPLVRVIFIEALYRAWSILHHHPYHK